ncbi:hypothetical protein BH24CHL4_BH24CHL4_12860 [soil metagenome]
MLSPHCPRCMPDAGASQVLVFKRQQLNRRDRRQLPPVIILVWIEFHLPLKDKDLGIERRIRLHGIHWPFAHRMTEIR